LALPDVRERKSGGNDGRACLTGDRAEKGMDRKKSVMEISQMLFFALSTICNFSGSFSDQAMQHIFVQTLGW
jgi:hypothetical protein